MVDPSYPTSIWAKTVAGGSQIFFYFILFFFYDEVTNYCTGTGHLLTVPGRERARERGSAARRARLLSSVVVVFVVVFFFFYKARKIHLFITKISVSGEPLWLGISPPPAALSQRERPPTSGRRGDCFGRRGQWARIGTSFSSIHA